MRFQGIFLNEDMISKTYKQNSSEEGLKDPSLLLLGINTLLLFNSSMFNSRCLV